jgi:flagellar protein FliS
MNPAETYLLNKINTASPAELTLMLYDGIIKFCNMAVLGIQENNLEKAHINIIKAQSIIGELKATLRTDFPVASDFIKIYDYIQQSLIEANLNKEIAILEEVMEHIRGIRDTWKEVMKISKVS